MGLLERWIMDNGVRKVLGVAIAVLFFSAFCEVSLAQSEPARGDPSEVVSPDAAESENTEIEGNAFIDMQEGLPESLQPAPIPEDDITAEGKSDQPDEIIESGKEQQEPDAAPADHTVTVAEKVVTKAGELMEKTRHPLSFIEQKVPFFVKHDMIFFGRLELDAAKYGSGILSDESGGELRRLRLGLAGHFNALTNWNYKIEVDLTDRTSTLSDAFLYHASKRWGTIRVGNQKVAQSLSGQTSSVSMPFMERPLPVEAFRLQRRLGLGWDVHLRKLGANITVFYKDPNRNIGSSGYAGRFYINPKRFKGDVIHIGASYLKLKLEGDARFATHPESNVTSIALVDTGVRADIEDESIVGLELAGAQGPLTIRSEYYQASWAKDGLQNANFNGWYIEGSWFMTGETSNYQDGKFIRPTIHGERGAWEVALRASSIDLDDQDVAGGSEKNFSLGVNWYSRTHWRLMTNLIKVKSDGPQGQENPWIIQLRTQYFF
jgi:phosphate-selective porin OprO/OprP